MSHQEIRDALTQKRSQYAWEAYLKHRKHRIEDRPREIIGKTFRDSLKSGDIGFRVCREGGEGQVVGHNKCCCKIGK